MPESNVIIPPGFAAGDYPERSVRLQSLPERLQEKMTSWLNKNRISNVKLVNHMLEQVERYSKDVVNWSEEDFNRQLAGLRQHMQAQGITDETVFRSFAMISEMSKRVLEKRPYEVQLIGSWFMINGLLAEMNTGEGKTLTATLPACTVALAGIPVHVITANDYLVERDASEMAPLYNAMGLTVGKVIEGMGLDERRKAYACDITYCTNKQLTFDYLRDRLSMGRHFSRRQLEAERLHSDNACIDQLLLHGLCFAIVDEADSVLIDEARTPLVISRPGDNPVEEQTYRQAIDIAGQLEQDRDFSIDAQNHVIELTEQGREKLERICRPTKGVWSGPRRREYLAKQALTALHLYVRDHHYLCKDGKVQIIDEHTGRVMQDRSWEKGLHQMIETKEGCELTANREALARISYQNFFRRYLRLAGMSGTLHEVAGELESVYGKQTVTVPPHRPLIKNGYPDQVYLNKADKWLAVVNRIKEIHCSGRPILVGTRTLADSEYLSHILSKAKLPHRVLNAKQDPHEAEVIAQAGQRNRITVATNMAGRGTDIKLAPEVIEPGGLHVIATERHEAGRIDRQLFGRCGRQGDPGSYEAILSLEDEIVKIYLPWVFQKILGSGNIISAVLAGKGRRWLILKAQRVAERHHKKIRSNLLKVDDKLKETLAFTGLME